MPGQLDLTEAGTAAIEIPDGASSEITDLMRVAIEKGADVGMLERLVGLYERVKDRDAATEFTAALLAFQTQCPPIRHNKQASFATGGGGQFKYTYSDLAEICKTINPILYPLGLSYKWDSQVSDAGDRIKVTCTVSHTSGHSVTASFEAPVDPGKGTSAAQDMAKVLMFGERKSLVQVLGIYTTDEDNDAAPSGTISDRDLADIEDLIETAGVDRAKFLIHLKVDTLSELPASRVARATSDLQERINNR